jgi:hypothetical protein
MEVGKILEIYQEPGLGEIDELESFTDGLSSLLQVGPRRVQVSAYRYFYVTESSKRKPREEEKDVICACPVTSRNIRKADELYKENRIESLIEQKEKEHRKTPFEKKKSTR